ncbi:MAG: isochorismatase family cysteine hydrolase [Ferroplasma sp.]
MKTAGNKEIFETLEEIVKPCHTVLVNWDLQNGLVSNIFNKDQFVKNVKSINDAARKSGMPIVYTKITPLPPRYMAASNIYTYMKRFGVTDISKMPVFMKPGSVEAEIYSEFKPQEEDLVLNKNTASIFIGTNFDNMMKAAGIKTIIFAGIATEIGVESSVRDSVNLGYYTVVASDSCSSHSKEGHEAALKSMSAVSMVLSTEEIISAFMAK